MRETTRNPRLYELMIIVAPDVSEDELPGVIDRVGGFITTAGGNVTDTLRESPWGRRRLAYAIRHGGRDVRDGFYTVYHFDAPPPAIADIERELLLTDQVMRFLVTHFTPQPISAQPEEESEGAEAETGEEVAAEAAEAPIVAEESATVAPEAEETTTEEPTAEESTAEAVKAEAESEKEAPAKKPATRRKKAAPAEEVETTAEPTDE